MYLWHCRLLELLEFQSCRPYMCLEGYRDKTMGNIDKSVILPVTCISLT